MRVGGWSEARRVSARIRMLGNKLSKGGVFTHRQTNSPVYISWRSMKQRCNNPKNNRYHLYGGRGITVCEAWLTFESFYAYVGDRPEGKTLDRIDNEGNYEPGNVRWASPVKQANNRRKRNGK